MPSAAWPTRSCSASRRTTPASQPKHKPEQLQPVQRLLRRAHEQRHRQSCLLPATVTGGRNARCSGPTDPQADCDVSVPGIGIDHASNIFLRGFLELTNRPISALRATPRSRRAMLVDAPTAGYTQSDVAATELRGSAVGADCPSAAPFQVTAGIASRPWRHRVAHAGHVRGLRGTSTAPITFSIDNPRRRRHRSRPTQARTGPRQYRCGWTSPRTLRPGSIRRP